MRFLAIVLLAMGLFAGINPLRAQKKMVILGSSTSACYNVDVNTSCYVGRLRTFYGVPASAIDNQLAASGFTVYRAMPTGYVSPYQDPNLQTDPGHNITAAVNMVPKPTVILVNFPTNAYNTLPFDSIMFCLRTIRNYALANQVPCFITTSQPRTDNGFNTPEIKAKLARIKDSVLFEFGAFAVDFYTGMFDPADYSILPAYRNLDGNGNPDYIHFNAAGHAVLAQRVEAANVFNATLPATFLKLNATYQDKTNLVGWTTAKEIDVASYEIQRSSDGIGYTALGSVPANNRAGNNQYQFSDKQPFKGWNYYKIVIVDKDGKRQSSPVLKVFVNTGKLGIKRILNQPSQVILEMQSDEAQTTELQLVSSTGALIRKESKRIGAGDVTLPVNTATLSKGVYYIRLTTAPGQTIVTSFIKN
jgi:lysophospholipase L1-like esterase